MAGNSPSVAQFLSTPSARRATAFVSPESSPGRNFYPRPPRGGRHEHLTAEVVRANISIHALREEGDFYVATAHRHLTIFLSTPSARRAT